MEECMNKVSKMTSLPQGAGGSELGARKIVTRFGKADLMYA